MKQEGSVRARCKYWLHHTCLLNCFVVYICTHVINKSMAHSFVLNDQYKDYKLKQYFNMAKILDLRNS